MTYQPYIVKPTADGLRPPFTASVAFPSTTSELRLSVETHSPLACPDHYSANPWNSVGDPLGIGFDPELVVPIVPAFATYILHRRPSNGPQMGADLAAKPYLIAWSRVSQLRHAQGDFISNILEMKSPT